MTNEAFGGIKMTQLLKNTDWLLTDGISVRFGYPLDDGARTDCRANGRPQFQLPSAPRRQRGCHRTGIDSSRLHIDGHLPAPQHCHQYALPTAHDGRLRKRRADEAARLLGGSGCK